MFRAGQKPKHFRHHRPRQRQNGLTSASRRGSRRFVHGGWMRRRLTVAAARTSPDTGSDPCDSTRGTADLPGVCLHTAHHDPSGDRRTDGPPVLLVSNTSRAPARGVPARSWSGSSREAAEVQTVFYSYKRRLLRLRLSSEDERAAPWRQQVTCLRPCDGFMTISTVKRSSHDRMTERHRGRPAHIGQVC
jgi:hypothetical protein